MSLKRDTVLLFFRYGGKVYRKLTAMLWNPYCERLS